MNHQITTVELTDLDIRAIHAAIQWAEMLEERGKLEIYEYQKEAFAKLKKIEEKS